MYIYYYFQEHPAYHWPNVVMMISNQSTDGVITDKFNSYMIMYI